MEQPLSGKRVAVLVETEFIPTEIDCYQTRFPELGAQVDLLTYLWGNPQRELISDIDDPNKPIKDLRTLPVTKDVADANPDDYDIVINQLHPRQQLGDRILILLSEWGYWARRNWPHLLKFSCL